MPRCTVCSLSLGPPDFMNTLYGYYICVTSPGFVNLYPQNHLQWCIFQNFFFFHYLLRFWGSSHVGNKPWFISSLPYSYFHGHLYSSRYLASPQVCLHLIWSVASSSFTSAVLMFILTSSHHRFIGLPFGLV